ncbi:MAG: site-specific DNA-methyltransferase, partial [Chloroflexota bacterium]
RTSSGGKAGSKPNSIVLDPFLGSGTTGMVCLDNGRRFLGIELKEEYAKLARQRLSERTIGIAL